MAAADLGGRIELILEDEPQISLSALDKRLNGPSPKLKKGKKQKGDWRTYPKLSIKAELERLRPVEKPHFAARPKPIPLETLGAEWSRLDSEIASYRNEIRKYGEKYKDPAEEYYAIRKLQDDKGIDLLRRIKLLLLNLEEHGSDANALIILLKGQEKNLEEIDRTIEEEWDKLELTDAGKAVRDEVTMKELLKTPLMAPFSHVVL